MSVDHYDCSCCGDTGIYEEYTASTECCGERICSRCVIGEPTNGERGDYIYSWCNPEYGEVSKFHCPFCSRKSDKISDRQIIDFLLIETGMNLDEVKMRILKERHGVQPPDMEKLNAMAKKYFPDMKDVTVEPVSLNGGMYVYGFSTEMENHLTEEAMLLREIEQEWPKLIILGIG